MMQILHKYGHDYKLVFVGEAAMSPYEIAYPGGSIEHHNEEAGAVWIKRMLDVYSKAAWINPTPEERWQYYESIPMVRELMEDRMYPLTLAGLENAMRALAR
jgi:hypothetical protein